MRIVLSIALIFCVLFVNAQDSQFTIKGMLINKEDKSPVPYAHIINQAKKSMTVSNIEGIFQKSASPGDTLMVSIIGYEAYAFVISEKANSSFEMIIELTPSSRLLEAVKVYAFKPEEDFKREILELETLHNPNQKQVNLPKITFEPDYSSYFNTPPPGSTQVATFGTGARLTPFKYVDKEKAKVNQLEKRKEIIHSKYNEYIVSEITGLKGEELKKFIDWCNMDENFIVESNAYDIAKALLACLDDYKKEDRM